MAALSLFDAMEFSMPENCLEESFGLSAEILAADIGSEGSILDSDLGHLDCLKYEPEQPTSQSFDDLLFEVAGKERPQILFFQFMIVMKLQNNELEKIHFLESCHGPCTFEY